MQQTLPCPKCGSQNPVGHRFCLACGARLNTQRQPKTNWFKKHLNCTFAIPSGLLLFLALVATLPWPGEEYYPWPVFIFIAECLVTLPLAIWVLRQKGQSQLHPLWCLLPIGGGALFPPLWYLPAMGGLLALVIPLILRNRLETRERIIKKEKPAPTRRSTMIALVVLGCIVLIAIGSLAYYHVSRDVPRYTADQVLVVARSNSPNCKYTSLLPYLFSQAPPKTEYVEASFATEYLGDGVWRITKTCPSNTKGSGCWYFYEDTGSLKKHF